MRCDDDWYNRQDATWSTYQEPHRTKKRNEGEEKVRAWKAKEKQEAMEAVEAEAEPTQPMGVDEPTESRQQQQQAMDVDGRTDVDGRNGPPCRMRARPVKGKGVVGRRHAKLARPRLLRRPGG